ncbi:ATP-grasp domain-containing protein [Priestia koreensis]|uniref:ATP-grasp domain-containing protein n=2 Tax=Priestia koreensis TaxID=284581 RepID=UPI00203E4412|nr:ATP-grasp domain-containing protein [Priestia koreensis]MCM3004764.1 ATP-grasp domain-containing protein [Priestia koreensis]
MIIMNEKIVSPLLRETINDLNLTVVKEGKDAQSFFSEEMNETKMLTNSESCLTVLEKYQPSSKAYEWSKLLKDKGELRTILSKMYPDYFYRVVKMTDLFDISPVDLSFPLVLKPTMGYSSVGVYKVKSADQWEESVEKLNVELMLSKNVHNSTVINGEQILIEEWIQGEEYAIDGYYDEHGNPVILNMFKRMFKDEYDTSDRIYFTSKEVIEEIYDDTIAFMEKLQTVVPLHNYPVHFEVKKQGNKVIPIEINPLRFAGAGTTDLGMYAYGSNVYKHYFMGTSPNWNEICEGMDDSIYSFSCAEIPMEIVRQNIEYIDHQQFKQQFQTILEYRELNVVDDRTFAIVFFKSTNLEENKAILNLDLSLFIHHKEANVLIDKEGIS